MPTSSARSIIRFLHHNHITAKPPSTPMYFSQILPRHLQNNHLSSSSISSFRKIIGNYSIRNPRKILDINLSGFNVNLGIKTPEMFFRYREAIRLQMEAFLRRNHLVLLGTGGTVACIVLWKVIFGISGTFIGSSEAMDEYGFLALSAAIVAFSGLYLRSRLTINTDKVYRMAMRKINKSAEIVEIMGTPLTGTDVRACIMCGGGVTLKNFKVGLWSKRCFLIFPLRGSERKGLVSVEAKNKAGKYEIKLLSVDISMETEDDQRLFLIGNEEEYKIGGGLINELRDPVIKAMEATKEFEDHDLKEAEEDAERDYQEAEQRHREELEKIKKK